MSCRVGGREVFLDDALALKLPQAVAIRDWRLGALKLALSFATFVYVVIIELVLNQGYMLVGTAAGSVQTSLQQPPDPMRFLPCPAYCLDVLLPCGVNQTTYELNATHYRALNGDLGWLPRQPCTYLDSNWLQTDTLQPEGGERTRHDPLGARQCPPAQPLLHG